MFHTFTQRWMNGRGNQRAKCFQIKTSCPWLSFQKPIPFFKINDIGFFHCVKKRWSKSVNWRCGFKAECFMSRKERQTLYAVCKINEANPDAQVTLILGWRDGCVYKAGTSHLTLSVVWAFAGNRQHQRHCGLETWQIRDPAVPRVQCEDKPHVSEDEKIALTM